MQHHFALDDDPHALWLGAPRRRLPRCSIEVDGDAPCAVAARRHGQRLRLTVDGAPSSGRARVRRRRRPFVHVAAATYRSRRYVDPRARRGQATHGARPTTSRARRCRASSCRVRGRSRASASRDGDTLLVDREHEAADRDHRAWRDGVGRRASQSRVGQTFERGAAAGRRSQPERRTQHDAPHREPHRHRVRASSSPTAAHNRALRRRAPRAPAGRRATSARSATSSGCARQNKLFVRERLELLLDPGTPFLELSTLAANMRL